MAARLYTDEHIARSVVNGLRRRGVDVLTCQDGGMLGAGDEEQLAFAAADSRSILTQDDDFLRLHADGRLHCGILYAPQQAAAGEMIRAVVLICEVLSSDDMVNHVEFL